MKRREPLGLDLTPIIDVVFILLLFFIVSSVFKKDELALILDLPTSSAKELKIDEEQVFIELSSNKLAIKGIEVSFESLEDNLKAIENKHKPVLVRIDKKVEYHRVVKVLDLLQKYDLTNLALVTNENEKKKD
ncbi:ExbD/TolR family protein [Arcobacter sp. YIC-464]|uniref:ExbD/TolR family protein n=1 Tax=Arcobacter sp. YIC-464 TaxID=3376631 RepID=UPI003C187E63